LEAGKLVLELDTVCATEVCKEARESLEMLAQKAGVGIDIAEPNTDAPFIGEHKRMVQVIINLLSNAIKFSPAGTTVTLGVDEKPDSVEISVADQGPGIPAEDRAVIFDKFRQSRATSNVDIKGSGIGLAIVRAIAEAHHGQVGVDSRPGGGSIFWVRVPKNLNTKGGRSDRIQRPARSLASSGEEGL
jgi:signal transduction histidine kinase